MLMIFLFIPLTLTKKSLRSFSSHLGLFFLCFKTSKLLSLLFLSVHVDLGIVFTYTPSVCCDDGSCCTYSRIAESCTFATTHIE